MQLLKGDEPKDPGELEEKDVIGPGDSGTGVNDNKKEEGDDEDDVILEV